MIVIIIIKHFSQGHLQGKCYYDKQSITVSCHVTGCAAFEWIRKLDSCKHVTHT